jgi:hypothetical protein
MNNFYLKLMLLFAVIFAGNINAQITTSAISGNVKDDKGIAIPFATVVAIHTPTGSNYVSTTRDDGSFSINGMKVGGPYTVKALMTGFQPIAEENIILQLAIPYKLKLVMKSTSTELQEVLIISKSENKLMSSDNKGTSTNIGKRTLESLPTLSRSITDFTKLTPQSNGTSFGGQDNRLNNLSIDGSTFNNNFGLQALPGSQTNSTPISLDAIEEIQVNLSPYNLRERDFTGAGINAVTRSGTNDFSGSAFFNTRNRNFVGKKADTTDVSKSISSFDVKQFGFRLGGPIIKNKLFFFVNGEGERRSDPGTTFFARNANNVSENNITSVQQSDLDGLSSYLKDKYNYDPGKYQDYNLNTYSNKLLAKIDWNISDKHKFSVRYSYLRSSRDVPVSNSGSSGGRRDNLLSMSFQNSNYVINNDINSIVAELNSNFTSKFSNNIIIGYTGNRDYRLIKGTPFPLVDIKDKKNGNNYITFGTELFTPNNRLNSDNLQFQNNSSIELKGGNSLSFGINYERFSFVNTFTPTIYGQYSYNNLSEFYLSSNSYLNNTTDTVKKNYNLTYSNIDDGKLWSADLKANTAGAYIQNNWSPTEYFNLNYGVRIDVPFFSSKGAQNDSVSKYNFKDGSNDAYKISTSSLPSIKNNVLVNPRIGFNWDVYHNKSFVLRGGTGLFSGRPPFVWIANQFGNNGVQSGSISSILGNSGNPSSTNPIYPFNPDVSANIPKNLTPNTPARSYNIAATDPNFKYPQLWKGNVAIDKKIIWNVIGTFEMNASKGINDVYYINANVGSVKDSLKGIDNRPKYSINRINSKISDATVLKNKNGSFAYNFTFKLERPIINGLGAMVAYNFAVSKDYISAGSIAFNSWRDNVSVNGNNFVDLAYSNNDQRHRIISNVSYRKEFSKIFAFSVNLFTESRNQGRFSYTYTGDINGDGNSTANDLMYIPKEGETQFISIPATPSSPAFSIQQQNDAFEAYIKQDPYLSANRGKYAERNGAILPWVTRFDLSTMVEFFIKTGAEKNKRHTLQLRADMFNVGNFISSKWGVGDIVNRQQILKYENAVGGVPKFTMNRNSSGSLDYKTTRKSAFLNDVWQAQFGVRYYF